MEKISEYFGICGFVSFCVFLFTDTEFFLRMTVVMFILATITYLVGKFFNLPPHTSIWMDDDKEPTQDNVAKTEKPVGDIKEEKFQAAKYDELVRLKSDPNFDKDDAPILVAVHTADAEEEMSTKELTAKDLYEEIYNETDIGRQFVDVMMVIRSRPEKKANKDQDNPWAQCVKVDYDKYLAMRQKLMSDLKQLPNQDTPQFWMGLNTLSPAQLRHEIESGTTIGKEFVEMMVTEWESENDEEEPERI